MTNIIVYQIRICHNTKPHKTIQNHTKPHFSRFFSHAKLAKNHGHCAESPRALHTALLPQLLSIAEAAALEGSAALDVEFVAHTSDLPLLGAVSKTWGKPVGKLFGVFGGKTINFWIWVHQSNEDQSKLKLNLIESNLIRSNPI